MISKKSKLYLSIIFVIIVLFLLFFRTMEQKYKTNSTLWQSNNIQNYIYTLHVSNPQMGLKIGLAKVVVLDKQVEKNENTHQPLERLHSEDLISIETIFNKIHALISNQDKTFRGMCIAYDDQYGYPKTFTIAYKSNVLRVTYTITDFHILEEDKIKDNEPICASYAMINKYENKLHPEKIKKQTFKNRYIMNMANASYLYDGYCK